MELDEDNGGSAAACRAWLDAEGRKASWVAGRLGVDESAVSHWLAGRRRPEQPAREALEALSGGAVRADRW